MSEAVRTMRPGPQRRTILDLVAFVGAMATFGFKAIGAIPLSVARYGDEYRRQIANLSLGSGFLIALTGTLGLIIVESLFIGVEVGIQGFQGLDSLGIAPLTGFVSAYANTREIAPLIAAVAIASQIGCRFTAQLGAQRISEEIDALEVMAVPPVHYLVSTRIAAALTITTPLYLMGLLGSYVGTRLTVGYLYGQDLGTYDHYFSLFLQPMDIVFSALKVFVFAVFIVIIHTYYGFNASGGPEGVGIATARAVRATIVIVAVSDVLMTMLFWGLDSVRLSGG